MAALRNALKARLDTGDLGIGATIRIGRTADMPLVLKQAGFDFLWLDREHGVVSLDASYQMAWSAIGAGIAPLIRLATHVPAEINLVLTNGFLGVIAPHVETAEQAAAIAACCRFPPGGVRSVPAGFPHFQWEAVPFAKAAEALNRETLCVVMLESRLAIRNAEAIASVPGVDVLKIGASDLSFEAGIPSQDGHPFIHDAVSDVVAACAKHGKHAGIGGVSDSELLSTFTGMGIRYVSAGPDLAFLVEAARRRVTTIRDSLL